MALLLPFYVPILDLPAFHYPLTTHLFAEPLPWGGAGVGSVATFKTEE